MPTGQSKINCEVLSAVLFVLAMAEWVEVEVQRKVQPCLLLIFVRILDSTLKFDLSLFVGRDGSFQ